MSFITLISFLMILLNGFSALAQTPSPSREHAKSTECIRVHNPDLQIGDKHFAVVSFSKEAPNCGIRNAIRMFPMLDESGKPLDDQAWLRSTYAANQEGKNPTMRRGCVELPNHRPPTDATIEEQKFCSKGLTHYFGIPSNGWRAIINIPTTRWYTFFEQQAAVAAKACTELEKIPNPTEDATRTLDECRKAHSIGTLVTPPPAPVVVPVVPPPPDVPTLQKMLDQANGEIQSLNQRISVLNAMLEAATSFKPFRANVWLAVALGLGLFVIVDGRRRNRERQALERKIREQADGLVEKNDQLRDRQSLIETNSKLQSDITVLEDSKKSLETKNREFQRQRELNLKQKEQDKKNSVPMDQHLEVVQFQRREHVQEKKDLAAKSERENAALAKQITNLQAQLAAKETALNEALAMCEQYGPVVQSLESKNSKLMTENAELFGKVVEREKAIKFLCGMSDDGEELDMASIPPPPMPSVPPPAEPSSTLATVKTSPPTTEISSPPIFAPTPKGAQYRKNTLQFPPVSVPSSLGFAPQAEPPQPQVEMEGDVLRNCLMNVIETLEPGASMVVEGASAEDLMKHAESVALNVNFQLSEALRAKEVAETKSQTVLSRWEESERIHQAAASQEQAPSKSVASPRAGYEISSLEELQGVELTWYMRNIFSEIWRRIRKYGEQFEMELISRDDVRVAWAGLKSVKLLLSSELLLAMGQEVKEAYYLDDIFDLARVLKMGDSCLLPSKVQTSSSIVTKTLVPGPNMLPFPNGTDGEPGPVR